MANAATNNWKRLQWYIAGGIILAAVAVGFWTDAATRELDEKRRQAKIDLAASQFDNCVVNVEHRQKVEFCRCYSDRYASFIWDDERPASLGRDDFKTLAQAESEKIAQVCDAIVTG